MSDIGWPFGKPQPTQCSRCAETPARWSDAAGEYVCAACHAEASPDVGPVRRVEAWRTDSPVTASDFFDGVEAESA